MQNNKIISIKNLTCVFEKKTENEKIALNDFSYDFDEGKIHFIIGNSGSGKTTLVLHLNGLIKSKIGDIVVDDLAILAKHHKIKNAKKLRRIISLVFQYPEYQLFKETVKQDIIFGPKSLKIPKIKYHDINTKKIKQFISNNLDNVYSELAKNYNIKDFDYFSKNYQILKITWNKKNANVIFLLKKQKMKYSFEYQETSLQEIEHEIALKYLNKLGLDVSYLERSPFGLSGGQKRRVAIAGILAIEPKILVFDEPTAGLDPIGEREMLDIIINEKKEGKTVIVITHTMDHVLEIGDNVVVLDKGKIIFSGEPYTVFCNKALYEKTNILKPKVIDVIDKLVAKNSKFNYLYNEKPRNCEALAQCLLMENKGAE